MEVHIRISLAYHCPACGEKNEREIDREFFETPERCSACGHVVWGERTK